VRYIEEQGVDIFCWTVDDLSEARRLLAAGADGIISNDLELLDELRRGQQVGEEPASDVQQPLSRAGEV